MTRLLLLLVSVLFVCTSCKQSNNRSNNDQGTDQLPVYNDILNELVESHFYNRYLGKDAEGFLSEYVNNPADSLNVEKGIISLRNSLVNDTSLFCTVYLDTVFFDQLPSWSEFQNDSSAFSLQIIKLFSNFQQDPQGIIAHLNRPQTVYNSENFVLNTARIKSISAEKSDQPNCRIGKVTFSDLIINKSNDEGILYYEFYCGGRCGKGELLYVKRIKNKWIIAETLRTWIS